MYKKYNLVYSNKIKSKTVFIMIIFIKFRVVDKSVRISIMNSSRVIFNNRMILTSREKKNG